MTESEAGTGQVASTPVERNDRKVRQGTVVSDRGDKTVVVRVDRRIRHPLYHKAMIRSKKYHVHDEKNEYQVGDVVRIQETRPISKLKRWRVTELVERPDRI
jgi:small subunit ribosomal protein S17